MSSRSFFTPQAGRQGKSGVKKEDEWGVTSSQAEFRAYEPAEMKNARDGPRHTKTCQQSRSDHGTQPKKTEKGPPNYNWHRFEESFPDHTQSAYTASEQSAASRQRVSQTQGSRPQAGGKQEIPAWAKTHMNPMPQKKMDHTSSYTQHQLEAQQARHGHFPYRDEFAPRSKRLLYEMAHARVCADSVASGSTATASAFTMSSRNSAKRSGVARSCSEASLVSSHHTADSDRVPGGIAKRRAEAQFKSPSLWPADQEWYMEKLEKDGPAGLTFSNFKPGYYQRSCKMDVEQTMAIKDLLGGHKESVFGG